MEKKDFAFENEYVKIIKPTKEIEKEIVAILKDSNVKEDNGIMAAYYILNKLCVAKNEEYDFSKYSLEEFEEMIKEIHLYDGLQEIINAVSLISSDATIHELQYTALGIKSQRIQLLVQLIKEESESLGGLSKELYFAEKERKNMEKLVDAYREKRMLRKEIEKHSDGVE